MSREPKTAHQSHSKFSRLTFRATGQTSEYRTKYGYDSVGNRTNRSAGLFPVEQNMSFGTNDWVTTDLSHDMYDSNGNTRTNGSDWFVYDVENQIISANVAGKSLSFFYNGDGVRVSKSVNGQTTNYLVAALNPTGYAQVLEELDGSGTVVRRYGIGHDLITQSRLTGGSWEIRFYGYDGHGSVRFLTDTGGTITDTYTFDSYGTLIAQTSTSGPTPNNYLYTGEQYDPDLGMYYLRARYYNPLVGRFWTRDTVDGEREKPSSLHKYQYGAQNPVNTSDPTGNETVDSLSIVGEFYRDNSSVGKSFDSGIRKRFDPDKRIDVRLSGGEYKLQDEAAKDALLAVLDRSINIDEEFSGVIVWTQSRFRYSYPEEGFRLRDGGKGSYSAKYFILGPAMKLAAAYHTHGNFSNPEKTDLDEGSSKFSDDDKKGAAGMPKPFSLYLGTPNGEVKRYDPDPDQYRRGTTWVIYSKKRSCPQEIREK